MTYNGTAPYTKGPVVEYPTAPHVPWHPGGFPATEHWAALVNDARWGMGIVNTDTTTFLGGFAGTPGSGGPQDPQTGYLAPIAKVQLGPASVYTFTFHLVLGDLDTIRSYAYAVRPAGNGTRLGGK